jgi:hypothetical protein
MSHQDVDEHRVELPTPGVHGEEMGVQLQPNAGEITSYKNSKGAREQFVDVPYQTFHIDPEIWQQYSTGAKAMYVCYNTCMREVEIKEEDKKNEHRGRHCAFMPMSDLVCSPGFGTVVSAFNLPCAPELHRGVGAAIRLQFCRRQGTT